MACNGVIFDSYIDLHEMQYDFLFLCYAIFFNFGVPFMIFTLIAIEIN